MSAPNIDVMCITEVADGAVTARRFGKFTADGVKQIDATGDRADVIFMHDQEDGKAVSCYTLGIHEVTSGAAFNNGDELMSDNAGKAIAWSSGSGRYRAGVARQTVSAANLRASVYHFPDMTPVA